MQGLKYLGGSNLFCFLDNFDISSDPVSSIMVFSSCYLFLVHSSSSSFSFIYS